MVVPRDFQDEVHAAADKDRAGTLALMADEAAGMLWEREGLRLVARAQCQRNSLPPVSTNGTVSYQLTATQAEFCPHKVGQRLVIRHKFISLE